MNATLKPINPAADAAFRPPDDGWIHVSPLGRYPVHLGGGDVEILIDAAACADQVAAFRAEAAAAGDAWGGMLVDFDHFSLDQDKSTEAAGWADALDARPDGLWARVRWTDSGLAAIRGGRFRYTSPVHLPRDCRRDGGAYVPARLHRLALTNDPRMLQGISRMRPISSRTGADASDGQQTTPPPAPGGTKGPQPMDYKTMLLGLLGLPAEATDDEITAAITARDEADAAAAKTLEQKDEELKALASRAGKAEAALGDLRADADIAALEKEGYSFAARDQVKAAIIASRETFLAGIRALKPAAAQAAEPLRSRQDARVPGASGPATRDEAIAAEQAKHNFKRRADAVASAQRAYPALWKD